MYELNSSLGKTPRFYLPLQRTDPDLTISWVFIFRSYLGTYHESQPIASSFFLHASCHPFKTLCLCTLLDQNMSPVSLFHVPCYSPNFPRILLHQHTYISLFHVCNLSFFQQPSYTSPPAYVIFPHPCLLPPFEFPSYTAPSSYVILPHPCSSSSSQSSSSHTPPHPSPSG